MSLGGKRVPILPITELTEEVGQNTGTANLNNSSFPDKALDGGVHVNPRQYLRKDNKRCFDLRLCFSSDGGGINPGNV